MNNRFAILLLLAVQMIACQPEKVPIDYGLDKCHFCKMTIVDQRFGAELVTSKGKVYKFDATECLIHFIDTKEVPAREMALLLTNTYDQPGDLLEVGQCSFLQCENMPSPMGAFINPFSNEDLARETLELNAGRIYQWQELTDRLAELHSQ